MQEGFFRWSVELDWLALIAVEGGFGGWDVPARSCDITLAHTHVTDLCPRPAQYWGGPPR